MQRRIFILYTVPRCKEGTAVFQSTRPLLTLMHIRAQDDHATFDAEYQNAPVNDEDALFTHCLHFQVNRLNEWVFYGACDLSLGKGGASREPSELLVGGFNCATGVLDVVEAQIRKRCPDAINSNIIALQK